MARSIGEIETLEVTIGKITIHTEISDTGCHTDFLVNGHRQNRKYHKTETEARMFFKTGLHEMIKEIKL